MIDLYHSLLRIHRGGIDVQFCWVPAHEGVKGNENADKLAKEALLKEISVPIPLGKGEGKAIVKRKGGRKTRKEGYIIKFKSLLVLIQCNTIQIKNHKERNRREEIWITRLRVDHTGLNSTLFLMGNRNNENCDNWGVKENAEHVILDCILYEVERQVLQNRVHECNLMGILGSEGEGKGYGLCKFLNYTRLMRRIWVQLKGHDVTHSCTVGGSMHLQVVCNLLLTKRRRRRHWLASAGVFD